jgi:replicative DNA helicase
MEQANSVELNHYQRALEMIEHNRTREINAIPIPFNRFTHYFPGIEHSTYTIVTASSGVGKSQFTDFAFLHTPVHYFFHNPDKVKVKIIYYSLEMNPTIKALQCIAHKVFIDTSTEKQMGQRIGIKNMMSVGAKLEDSNLDLIKGHDDYFDWFFQVVDLHGGPVVPYAIYMDLIRFFKATGTIHNRVTVDRRYDEKLKKDVEYRREVFDRYVPNDPDLFTVLIVDHAALVQTQKGLNKRENMEKLSSYFMTLRNQFGLAVVSIQQQAADQESKDNYRRPTMSGLGDNKAVQRDADYIFGLYDPTRHKERKTNGWEINKMHHRYRELILMKSRYGPSSLSTDLFYDGTVENFFEMPDALAKYEDPKHQRIHDESVMGYYKLAKSLPMIM